MKRILIILVSLIICSCSKDNNKSDNNTIEQKIIGKWIWKASCGGYTGNCDYPDTNTISSIEFTNNNTFSQKFNDSIYSIGEYVINKKITTRDTSYDLLFFNNNVIKLINKTKYYITTVTDTFKTHIMIYNNDLEISYGDIIDSYKK